MSISLYDRASEAARYVLTKAQGRSPRAAVVLGSGLGGVTVVSLGLLCPDVTSAYLPVLLQAAFIVDPESGVPLAEAVNIAVLVPLYETPAVIRLMRALGANVEETSTVPASIVTRQCG